MGMMQTMVENNQPVLCFRAAMLSGCKRIGSVCPWTYGVNEGQHEKEASKLEQLVENSESRSRFRCQGSCSRKCRQAGAD